ncbi:MAG: chemotaxis protein, partial [bacterium]|nr:chemotaxis protein [bacterium]
MMGKQIGLVTKIFLGFVGILLLLGGVAFIGYRGMSLVANKVEHADTVDAIVQLISQSRRQEKNFMLRGEQQYADAVVTILQELTRRAHDAKEKFTQQINKDQMGRVVAEVDEYATAFSVYVEAEHERNAT